MLHDWQQLNMREPQAAGMPDQARAAITPVDRWPAPLPRSHMDFVDRHWRAGRLSAVTLRHPLAIRPIEVRARGYDRPGSRWWFGSSCHRIGLMWQQMAIPTEHFIFVAGSFTDSGNEKLPYPAFRSQPHDMAISLPVIEVSYHCDSTGIRRPNRKSGALCVLYSARMCPQTVGQKFMTAFGQQVHIKLAQERAVIGVDTRLTHARPRDRRRRPDLQCLALSWPSRQAGRLSSRDDALLRNTLRTPPFPATPIEASRHPSFHRVLPGMNPRPGPGRLQEKPDSRFP